MWYEVTNGNTVRPADVDSTSSRSYVYVRRNITLVTEATNEDETIPAHYRWEETKIPREDWELYRTVMAHNATIGGDRVERQYNPGEYITVDGVLYRVTATIPAGGVIASGANAVETSITEELTRTN